MDFRYCLGITESVSTFARSSGATRPSCRMNFSMLVAPDVHEMTGDRGRGRHRRADEMGSRARPLPPLEIAVGRGGDAIAGRRQVVVHAEAHRAARLAPLEAGLGEDLVEAFLLRLLLHEPGPGDHDRELDVGRNAPAL